MSERRARLDALAITSLVGCAALWGLNQAASKVAVAEIPPLLQAGARSAGAAVLLALWAAWRRIPLAPLAGPALRGPALLSGSLFACEFGCIFIGLQYTSASRMAVFIYLAPFFVALGMPFVAAAERLRGAQWGGLALAFAGVVLALGDSLRGGPSAGGLQLVGDALGVLGALLWACTTLSIRATRLAAAPAEQTLMAQLLVSALWLGAAGRAAGEHWPAAVSPLAWGAFAFQTVVVTFASYLLWFWLVRHYVATQISTYTLLTPVFGLAAGVGLLGEPLGWRLLAALAAVAAGIALVTRAPRG